MLTKKIFFILLFSLTTNIYSQSNEVKELQSEIDNWKNYSFNQYVYDSDRNQIFDRNKNIGIISGVYSKWSSYSNNRDYEYIITPFDRNGNYGSTETRGITITNSYSKESHEKYIENRISEVFEKIDSQLEIEKKQNEVQAAINEKNRKRKDYIKEQLKKIENGKDSINSIIVDEFTRTQIIIDNHKKISNVVNWSLVFREEKNQNPIILGMDSRLYNGKDLHRSGNEGYGVRYYDIEYFSGKYGETFRKLIEFKKLIDEGNSISSKVELEIKKGNLEESLSNKYIFQQTDLQSNFYEVLSYSYSKEKSFALNGGYDYVYDGNSLEWDKFKSRSIDLRKLLREYDLYIFKLKLNTLYIVNWSFTKTFYDHVNLLNNFKEKSNNLSDFILFINSQTSSLGNWIDKPKKFYKELNKSFSEKDFETLKIILQNDIQNSINYVVDNDINLDNINKKTLIDLIVKY